MEESTEKTTASNMDAPRKSHHKVWIWLGIVGVVLVIVGVGGWLWHGTPGFCNSFCHKPMDSYVKGYESGDTALLITKHAEGKKGLECLDCHEAKMDQQLEEASSWVSGDYTVPLPAREFGTREFCLASGCHDEDKIIEATKDWGGAVGYNPHDPRHGKQQCYRCHSMHQKSVLMCDQCHKLELPKGWVAPAVNGVVTR